jgi:hypothetical protein
MMGRSEEPNLAALLGEREDVTEGRSLSGGGGTWGRRRNWRRMLSAVGEERAPLSLSLSQLFPVDWFALLPLFFPLLACPIFLSSHPNFFSRSICTMLCPWRS